MYRSYSSAMQVSVQNFRQLGGTAEFFVLSLGHDAISRWILQSNNMKFCENLGKGAMETMAMI
jgi:hypothetical protein